MGRYIQATASKPFLCAWKCCACSAVNVETPTARATGRADITLFQKEDRARELAREQAQKNLDALVGNIPKLVNKQLNYNTLTGCGVCRSCHAQQPWAKKPNYMLYTIIPVVIAIIAVFFLWEDASEYTSPILLAGIFAVLGAILLAEFLSGRSQSRAGKAMKEDSFRPLAITGSIPDDVSRDDPRLLAIISALTTSKQP